jgi:DNA-binding XRE family transcriptional regulator
LFSADATPRLKGGAVDRSRLADPKYYAKKAYQLLSRSDRPTDSNWVQESIGLIRDLERLMKTEFKDTRDFREKVEKFSDGYDLRRADPATRLRRARMKFNMTQKDLAQHLGYTSHAAIAQFEKRKRPPSRRVTEWLKSVGM